MTPRLLLVAASLLLPTAACADPWTEELARLAQRGEIAVRAVSDRIAGEGLVVVLLAKNKKTSLRAYRITAKKALLLHLEPGFGKDVSLAAIHDEEKIPDLAEDGSRIVAYVNESRSLAQRTLVVLRYSEGTLKRIGDFAEGRFEDLDSDGSPEIVERTRPLGRFFSVDCEETFHSLAESARRLRVYAWTGGKLSVVSRRHADYFLGSIKRLESALEVADIRATDRYGDYLGDALSLFFLHEEIGLKKKGWKKLVSLFPLRRGDPKPVRRCYEKLHAEMRDNLGIPSSW